MSAPETLPGTPATAGTHSPGVFVWHEFVAPSIDAAKAFYTQLFGWTVKEMKMGDGPAYHEIFAGEKPVGGFFALDGVPAHWNGYVSVPDVDQAVAKVTAGGGAVLMPPKDVPNVGRFAAVKDAQGAVFSLFKSAHGDPDTEVMPVFGEFCWDSLSTTDVEAAKAFYAGVIGWEAGDGVFKMGEKMEASFEQAPPGVPAAWLTHVFVEDMAATRTKAEGLGAKVLMAEVPAGPWGSFAVIQDPAGGVISLFQPNQEG